MSFSLVFGGTSNPEVNEAIGRFAARIIWGDEVSRFNGAFGTAGVLKDGVLIGAFVFHSWQPENGTIELSFASTDKRWLTRRIIREVFKNCFDVFQCQLVFARTADDNTITRSLGKRYGFKETILPRFRGRDKDEVLLTLTDDDWRASKWSSL